MSTPWVLPDGDQGAAGKQRRGGQAWPSLVARRRPRAEASLIDRLSVALPSASRRRNQTSRSPLIAGEGSVYQPKYTVWSMGLVGLEHDRVQSAHARGTVSRESVLVACTGKRLSSSRATNAGRSQKGPGTNGSVAQYASLARMCTRSGDL
jgi:hypothetical protein